MTIQLDCPSCVYPVNVPDHSAGRRVVCPHCRMPFIVPGRLATGLSWLVIGSAAVVVLAILLGGALVLGHRMGRSKDKGELWAAEAQVQGLSRKLNEAESDLAAKHAAREQLVAKLDELGRDREALLATAKKREDASAATIRELDGKLKAALGVAALGSRREADMAEDSYFRDLRKFQGTWKPTRFHVNGEDIAATLAAYEFECRFDKLVSTVDGPTGEILLRPGMTPPQIDLKPGKNFNGGKLIEGIYSFDAEGLVLCFARNGEARPVRFDPVNTVAVLHLSKVKKN